MSDNAKRYSNYLFIHVRHGSQNALLNMEDISAITERKGDGYLIITMRGGQNYEVEMTMEDLTPIMMASSEPVEFTFAD